MEKYIVFKSLPKLTFAHSYIAKEKIYPLPVVNNCIEITYVYSGEVFIQTGNSIKKYVSGDVILNTFDIKKQTVFKDICEIRTFIIHFDAQNYSEYIQNSFCLPKAIKSGEKAQKIAKLIDELIILYAEKDKYFLKLNALIFEILNTVSNQIAANNTKKSTVTFSDTAYVEKIKKYVIENLSKKISVRDIASYLSLSVQYTCYLFKKVEDTTITRFINQTKLDKVRDLVLLGNHTLAQAAFQVGERDTSYISRMFKKYYNTSITSLKKTIFYD